MSHVTKPKSKALESQLEQFALSLGASGAKVLSSEAISVKEELARMCKEPGCPNYGLSASCPPYVSGPDGFKSMLAEHSRVLVIKIEVPTEVLISEQRQEVFYLLHEIVSSVERKALELGFESPLGFAGGSCKQIFCNDKPDCLVLKGEKCRHPDKARPSMSGFGVDVGALTHSAGWQMKRLPAEPGSDSPETALAVGIVLLS